jgi:hypothetical protein
MKFVRIALVVFLVVGAVPPVRSQVGKPDPSLTKVAVKALTPRMCRVRQRGRGPDASERAVVSLSSNDLQDACGAAVWREYLRLPPLSRTGVR